MLVLQCEPLLFTCSLPGEREEAAAEFLGVAKLLGRLGFAERQARNQRPQMELPVEAARERVTRRATGSVSHPHVEHPPALEDVDT